MTRAFLRNLALSAALLVPGVAIAQTPAPTAQVSSTHLGAAREVVTLSGITRSFDAIVPQFAEQVKQTFGTTRPELNADLEQVLTAIKPEMEDRKSEMVALAANTFAQRLTEAELTDIAAFFKSPSGRRYVEMQPQILDEMFAEMQGWTQRLSEFIITRVRAEMKKKGHSI